MADISPVENYIRAITFTSPHHIPYEPVVKTAGWVGDMFWEGEAGADHWGVTWEYELAEYLPMVKDPPIKSPSDLDHYRAPEPVFTLRPGAAELFTAADRASYLVCGFHPNVIFERAWFLMGMERLFIALVEDRERLRGLLRQIADYQVAIAQEWVKQPIDMVFVGDDYGTQRSLMMAPDLWRELIKPELARVLAVYRDAGKWIKFHSCGHITEILDDLIELGVNIINPCQARANDLAAWGERFGGRVTFDGGVDTQHTMMLGSADEIRAETRLRMQQLGRDPRGGLLLWADQNMPFPAENRQVLFDFIVEHGVYPLTA